MWHETRNLFLEMDTLGAFGAFNVRLTLIFMFPFNLQVKFAILIRLVMFVLLNQLHVTLSIENGVLFMCFVAGLFLKSGARPHNT